ncbi:MAG TPA: enolase C-terminal domain-like protein [Chloroflexota bacterium]|nr:enolase C-terminal domain-like protein [Chloroflexota bacterium]
MTTKITDIKAREIFAGRGVLGLEVTVTADDGAVGMATPESGVSTGKYEAAFVLDGGERYRGLGTRQAAENVNGIIAPALIGMAVGDQMAIDRAMGELDGTPNKARLGANAIVGVSLAVLKAAANSAGLPLYRYIGGANACTLPIPINFISSGGRYRDPGNSRWFKPTYEFAAYGAGSYSAAMELSWRVIEQGKRIFKERYGERYVPTYNMSNLAGVISEDRELLDVMAESIARCGAEGKVGIYFDCAAECYYEKEIDRYVGLFSEGEKSRDDLIEHFKKLIATYPIVSIEDPLHEEDFEGHAILTKELGIEIVGDDLFTTNAERLKKAIALGAANSMVLKISQVGTVSEALAACRLAQANGYNVHPCGSRGDRDSIGDFAVGLNAGQLRAGDHNRLLTIEEELGPNAAWLGRDAYKGWKR